MRLIWRFSCDYPSQVLQPPNSMRFERVLVAFVLVAGMGLQQLGCSGVGPLFETPLSAVRGEVVAPSTVTDADPVIVYLESIERQPGHARMHSPVVIRVHDGAFSPHVVAVAAGQLLEFAIDGNVLHQLFSYDEHNAFDLDTSDGSRPVSVTLAHPGVVRVYCSLHPSESGTAFVVASPYFDVADPRGHWRITGVAPGRYQLKTWSEQTRPTKREIMVPVADVVEARDIPLTAGPRATK